MHVSTWSKRLGAIFNRVDDEPDTRQRHSNAPPLPPLRKGGKKRPDATDFPPPCEGGVGGVRAAAHAMHLKTALGHLNAKTHSV